MADLYRSFDLEDLSYALAWLREAGARSFAADDLRRIVNASLLVSSWGVSRTRRLVRVAEGLGWFRVERRDRNKVFYTITSKAPKTLPAIEMRLRRVENDHTLTPDTRAAVLTKMRDEFMRKVQGT